MSIKPAAVDGDTDILITFGPIQSQLRVKLLLETKSYQCPLVSRERLERCL